MNIINDTTTSLPFLTKDNVNFADVDVDESCGDMSVRFPLITDDMEFDWFIDWLNQKIRQQHYFIGNEPEPEFEDALAYSRDIDFIITMTDYGNYEFNLFRYVDGSCVSIRVNLGRDEIELFKPYMYEYFEPSYQLEQIRCDVGKSVNQIIPMKKLIDMKLVSDRIVGDTYKSAWMSENKKKCMICEVADFNNDKCPVIVSKFGF